MNFTALARIRLRNTVRWKRWQEKGILFLICWMNITEAVNTIKDIQCRPPKGAFYAFISIKETGLTSMEFCQRLLKETGVALAPGIGFGKEGDGYVRLCYANAMEKLKAGAERMDRFCQKI